MVRDHLGLGAGEFPGRVVVKGLLQRDLIVPIIAAATINSSIARKPRSAAVMSVAAIVTRAVCCVAIGRLRDIIEGRRRAEGRLFLFRR